jgi:hypothetical protein
MIFLFLWNIRPTLVISLAIPLSVIIAFIVIEPLGYTLNLMTMGGMALGVGLLVDNAVVVLENIFRHLEEENESHGEAAIKGTEEVALAITSSTFTNLVVFLPLIYVRGFIGKMTSPLAVTLSTTLLASLFVATTIVPMLAAVFLKKRKKGEYAKAYGETWFIPIRRAYEKFVAWIVRHKVLVILLSFAFFFVSLTLVPSIGLRFIPDIDRDFVIFTVTLPPGTKLSETMHYVNQVDSIIETIPGVQVSAALAGEAEEAVVASFFGGAGTNYASIRVKIIGLYESGTPTIDAMIWFIPADSLREIKCYGEVEGKSWNIPGIGSFQGFNPIKVDRNIGDAIIVRAPPPSISLDPIGYSEKIKKDVQSVVGDLKVFSWHDLLVYGAGSMQDVVTILLWGSMGVTLLLCGAAIKYVMDSIIIRR